MLLKDKVAVIYGAGGAVGGAVARTFAAEGALVCATSRSREPLPRLARIVDRVDVLDAYDEDAVDAHLGEVVDRYGQVDVSFNLISVDHVQGIALVDMATDDFTQGLQARIRSHFVTARAAGRRMVARGSGTILVLSATPDRTSIPFAGSFGVQCAAVEAFARALAVELSPRGVRVNAIRSAGSPDAAGVDDVFDMHARNAGQSRAAFDSQMARRALLSHLPSLTEVADVAALLASDHARAMTGAIANVTCGQLLD